MKYIVIFFITLYQRFLREALLSLGIASECCYIPTCSEYTKEAFQKHGFLKGFYLGTKRISRCGFCTEHRHDPLP